MIFSKSNVIDVAFNVPGCVGIYNFSDTTTITSSGGAVSSVRDTNSANTMLQPSGANQPITGTRSINGKNAIDFDGAASYLNVTAGIFPNQTNGGLSIIAVAQSDVVRSQSQFIFGSSASPRVYLGQDVNGNAIALISASTSKSSGVNVGTNPFVMYVTNDGATDTVKLRANSGDAKTFSQSTTGVPSSMLVGTTALMTSIWNGLIGAFAFYNRALSDDEALNWLRYFGNNWGVAI